MMIKRLVLGTAFLSGLAGGAVAADLPARNASPVFDAPAPAISWDGFYVGGQIGYAFYAQEKGLLLAPVPGLGGYGHPRGVIGGGHAGYNVVLPSGTVLNGFGPGSLVVGLEGDINGSDYHEPLNPATAGFQTVNRSNLDGSLRARVGVAIDRVLFYATGGAAFADFDSIYSSRVPVFNRVLSHTQAGWTVGAGAEYALTNQWSLRAEYRYSDFGTFEDAPVGRLLISKDNSQHRVQGGFSYRFGLPPAPVIARD